MGKPTGFIEYARQEAPVRPPMRRLEDFGEFHGSLGKEARREQAARCMNCGVPFCQSGMTLGGMVTGCPLHNLIPEWNDCVYRGDEEGALERLLKTNNFPEFTGRVCPALCEVACLCGVGDSPVTVRDNELSIVERAFSQGYMVPRPPAVCTGKRVAVIGSGPAGLACADTLNRRGHTVTVYEKSDRAGGLLMYGIPNMKLDKSVIARRVALMEAEGVRFVLCADIGRDIPFAEVRAQYDAVVLCCGAGEPRPLPAAEGAKGVLYAVDYLTAVTRSLLDPQSVQDVPPTRGKQVVVVGGGDTGNDCVGTALRLGCAGVVQLEIMPKPPEQRGENNPWPEYPRILKTDYGQQEAIAVGGKDPRLFSTTVKSIETDARGQITAVRTVRTVRGKDGKIGEEAGSEQRFACDLLLIAAGFTGCRPYVAEQSGVARTARGTLATADGGYATAQAGVFAAGDARRGQSLVVWAIAEGRACAAAVDEYLEQIG